MKINRHNSAPETGFSEKIICKKFGKLNIQLIFAARNPKSSMADTIADQLLHLGLQAYFMPCERPNKPYYIKLGNFTNPINYNHEDIVFSVEVHNDKLQNARVRHGYSIEVPLYAINTIEKIKHFLAAVKA